MSTETRDTGPDDDMAYLTGDDPAERRPVRMFQRARATVEYGPGGMQVLLGEGEHQRALEGVYRFMLSQQAGDEIPKLVLWTVQPSSSSVAIPEAELIDIAVLIARMDRMGRQLADATSERLQLAERAVLATLHEYAEDELAAQAVYGKNLTSMAYSRARRIVDDAEAHVRGEVQQRFPHVDELLARAWRLAEDSTDRLHSNPVPGSTPTDYANVTPDAMDVDLHAELAAVVRELCVQLAAAQRFTPNTEAET